MINEKEKGIQKEERCQSLTLSPISVWQLMCVNIHCPHSGLVVSYKKKTCETLPCRQFAGGFRWLKSSVELNGSDGWFPGSSFTLSCFVFFLALTDQSQQQSYGSLMCSLMGSPCLEGWFGEMACDGWVPGGRVWAMGTPPGTNPSIGPGIPPGATPTTPGGNLEVKKRR